MGGSRAATRKSSAQSRTAARIHNAEHARIERLMERLHSIRAKFKALHARGEAALKEHDYKALGDAIQRRVVSFRSTVPSSTSNARSSSADWRSRDRHRDGVVHSTRWQVAFDEAIVEAASVFGPGRARIYKAHVS